MSEEIKPVAWLTGDLLSSDCHEAEMQGREYQTKPVPLYTKQQLQPRVKMTQAEFDEFYELLSVGVSTIYDALNLISEDRGEMDEFENLYDRLFENSTSEQAVNQLEFARLWANFNALHLEETIEITPEKKWFVRLIPTIPTGDDDIYLDSERIVSPDYHSPKKAAATFDTKEQAEEWTNPLTEAVLLPVGDE